MAQTEFTKIWEQGAEAERNKILGQLLIANNKPRDTGNPLNDMTGIGGGKPLPKPTPAPKEMQLPIPGVDWRKFLVDLMINPEIASGPYRDNKAGNVDEVWKIRNHPNYKSLPSNEQWLKNLENKNESIYIIYMEARY